MYAYILSLMPLALKVKKTKEDAEDLLQDVALKMLEKKIYEKPFDEQTRYCRTALINTAYNNYETIRNRNARFNRLYDFRLIVKPSVYSSIEFKEVMQVKINPLFSKSLLAQVYGYSIKEICEATGAKQNAVLSRISYGRKAIKSKWT